MTNIIAFFRTVPVAPAFPDMSKATEASAVTIRGKEKHCLQIKTSSSYKNAAVQKEIVTAFNKTGYNASAPAFGVDERVSIDNRSTLASKVIKDINSSTSTFRKKVSNVAYAIKMAVIKFFKSIGNLFAKGEVIQLCPRIKEKKSSPYQNAAVQKEIVTAFYKAGYNASAPAFGVDDLTCVDNRSTLASKVIKDINSSTPTIWKRVSNCNLFAKAKKEDLAKNYKLNVEAVKAKQILITKFYNAKDKLAAKIKNNKKIIDARTHAKAVVAERIRVEMKNRVAKEIETAKRVLAAKIKANKHDIVDARTHVQTWYQRLAASFSKYVG